MFERSQLSSRPEVIQSLRWTKLPVLDDGFVCLVDIMGDDAAVVQAAKVSYGKDARDKQCCERDYDNDGRCDVHPQGLTLEQRDTKNRTLLRYLMRHRHCYAPWMEVLTTRGWVRWGECNPSENFLVPNPQTRTLQIERLPLLSFQTDDGLHLFENERMSYAVTPDHRMWFKGKYEETFSIQKVQDMPQWGHFDPLSGYKLRCGEVDKKASFLGFYLGDGSFASTNRVSFHLKKERKKEYLRGLVSSLGLEYEEARSSTHETAVVFYITITDWMREALGDRLECRCSDKGLPTWHLDCPSWVSGILAGLSQSDSYNSEDRDQKQYSSNSFDVIRLWEAVNAVSGVDTHAVKVDDNDIGILRSTAYLGSRTTLEARKQYFSFREYTGPVYCATSSTGLLMVRGGPDKFGFVCGNSTPFEMAELKFLVRVPMDCWRQWIRHRMASVNEYSTRYTDAIDSAQGTGPTEWRNQSKSNKQGSGTDGITEWPKGYEWKEQKPPIPLPEDLAAGFGGVLESKNEDGSLRFASATCVPFTPGDHLTKRELDLQTEARQVYEERLKFGVAREQARKDLPLSTYTEAYWKVDLHNLLHFLGLRMDSHAQLEIRQYATTIGEHIVAPLFPNVWQAFLDYRFNAFTVSALDQKALQYILSKVHPSASLVEEACVAAGWPEMGVRCSERDEFIAKLSRLK